MTCSITEMLAWSDPRPPYVRGYDDGLAGKPGPAIPQGDATWAQKLYNRGWMDGRDERARLQQEETQS